MKTAAWAFCVAVCTTAFSGAALAAPGFTTGNVNMRTGPDTAYPSVTVLPEGLPVDIKGCLEGQSWCDVATGIYRGWVYGEYLAMSYRGQPVLVPEYAPVLGLPVIGFNFARYWNRYYQGAPWWGQYNQWQNYRWQPRPGWGPPPPGPGPRPPGWWQPGYRPPPGPNPGWNNGPRPGWNGHPNPGPQPGWNNGPRPGWNGNQPGWQGNPRPGWNGNQPGWQGNPRPGGNGGPPPGPRPGWNGNPNPGPQPGGPGGPRPGGNGGPPPGPRPGGPPQGAPPPQQPQAAPQPQPQRQPGVQGQHRMPSGYQRPQQGQPACAPGQPCPPQGR
ncbi:MAG: SH3 domain-containing protein [Pseudomonadota bacterium]